MSYLDWLKNLGFDSDPFAKTNADEEERLESYFIAPPFYSAVRGDVNTPKSALVFAPRGNGKTALKRKIELSSVNEDFLCITYNSFRVVGKRLSDIDQDYHLCNIIRAIVIALITATKALGIKQLTKNDRHYIYLFAQNYLNTIDQAELKDCISSIKNFSDKAKEVWNTFTGPIGLVLNSLLERVGLASAEIKKFEKSGGNLGDSLDQLKILQTISYKFGYKSIYVLVDRVDENNLTSGGGGNSYKFVASLVTDLQLLELPGYGFKFFLWDLLLADYRKVARPDRVKYYEISWNAKQLTDMLSKRLKAYSSGKVTSLREFREGEFKFDLDLYAAYFAQGSPRNLIRICKEILDQQCEIGPESKHISQDAIVSGFERIAANISAERYPENLIKDLRKTKRCNFTIRYVYSDVFKFSQQAALNKIKGWKTRVLSIQSEPLRKPRVQEPANIMEFQTFYWQRLFLMTCQLAIFLTVSC